MIEPAIALFGTSEPQPTTTLLKAGPVLATLEAGALRRIRYNGIEVLRGIAFLVRDAAWDTAHSIINDLRIDHVGDGFSVRFSARAQTSAGVLPWSATINGDAAGRIRFEGVAEPQDDFTTNRTGFVVLHPLDGVAGECVTVTSVGGTKLDARFPFLIDPEPCFTDIRALRHRVSADVWAHCEMQGEDSWETEDHRNWLDASFKTYVRPLRLPYPYILKGGRKYQQSVTLGFSQSVAVPASSRGSTDVSVALGERNGERMPAIGLNAPASTMDANFTNAWLARKAGIQLLHGRIDPRVDEAAALIGRYAELAAACDARLVLELVAPCRRDIETELSEIAELLRERDLRLESVLVVPAEDKIRIDPGPPSPPIALLGQLYAAARKCFPDTAIGGGTLGWFAELNRNWPPFGLLDYVAYTTSSLVHAADDQTLVENLETFRHQARTVKAFAGTVPCRIAASSIALREGSFSPTIANRANIRATMANADPRQRGLMGSAWTLGSMIEMAASGIAAINPAALSGGSGIIDDRAAPRPGGGTHQPAILPLYHVAAGFASASGRAQIVAHSSDPFRVKALACESQEDDISLWLANVTNQAQPVRLPGDRPMLVRTLDISSFEAAAADPLFLTQPARMLNADRLELGPYAIALIEIEG